MRKSPLAPAPSAVPVAFSYIRFSHPSQADGDSLRRQTEAAAAWCERNGVCLDTSRTYHDLGKSAFKGTHRTDDRAALAAFLRLVDSDKVPRGSYLVIENLDRLSREEQVPATHLLTGILMKGIRVVQLMPSELVLTDKSDAFTIMRAVLELSRGHGESAVKSDRLARAWDAKRKAARQEGMVISRRLPAWVEMRGGKLRLIPSRAATVRKIFHLAANGYGQTRILQKLVADHVPAFGKRRACKEDGTNRIRYKKYSGDECYGSGRWCRAYIVNILTDRRATGEYQPRTRDGDDGEPIAGYFPAAVTEAEWLAARAGAASRRQARPTRQGKHIDIFTRLLRDAVDGGTYFACTRASGSKGALKHARMLLNTNAAESRAPLRSFPLATFERAFLTMLREIDPAEVLAQGEDVAPEEVQVLEGELSRVREKLAELTAELENGDVAALAAVLRKLEAREHELAEQLDDARQRSAVPLSDTWATTKTLAAALDAAENKADARLRLRAALRRVIDEIWLLVVGRGRDRFCAAQVYFAGSPHPRMLSVMHRPPKCNVRRDGRGVRTHGRWWAFSVRLGAERGLVDLRRREDAAKLGKVFADATLEVVEADAKGREAAARHGEGPGADGIQDHAVDTGSGLAGVRVATGEIG